MNKYEVILDRGRLRALDADSGKMYHVFVQIDETNLKVITSAYTSNDHPYELYRDDNDRLMLFNTDTGRQLLAVLVEIEDE